MDLNFYPYEDDDLSGFCYHQPVPGERLTHPIGQVIIFHLGLPVVVVVALQTIGTKPPLMLVLMATGAAW